MRRRTFVGLAAAAALGAAAAASRAQRAFPVRVQGLSMKPTLRPGDFVAVTPGQRPPRVGSVVVVKRPGGPEIVKRVRAGAGEPFEGARVPEGMVAIAGDNRLRSTDSRTWGPVPESEVVGVARLVYWPPRRWRILR